MNAELMRTELMKLYGPSWQARVRKMTDKQVTAIYLKFKSEGKIR